MKRNLRLIQRVMGKHKPDYIFLLTLSALFIFGLFMLASASSIFSFHEFGDSFFLLRRQLLRGVLPGIILFLFFAKFSFNTLRKFVAPLMLVSVVLLVAVFVPGIGADYGLAHSWISLGFFSFQPSELAKLAFVLYLALWFSSRKKEEIQSFWSGLFPFIVTLSLISGLLALEPDVGTMVIFGAFSIAIYFSAGARLSHIFLILISGSAVFYFLVLSAEYRLNRFLAFLNPNLDPLGAGYHIKQAFMAVGSGGLWGKGLGKSEQKFLYLPEVGGDSIFAVIAEELGFVVSSLFLLLIFFIIYRGFVIAKKSSDQFLSLTTVGIMSWFSAQAIFNIGAMIGLFPITGVPLPFVSYGGTAMMMNFAAMGIVFNASRFTRK